MRIEASAFPRTRALTIPRNRPDDVVTETVIVRFGVAPITRGSTLKIPERTPDDCWRERYEHRANVAKHRRTRRWVHIPPVIEIDCDDAALLLDSNLSLPSHVFVLPGRVFVYQLNEGTGAM